MRRGIGLAPRALRGLALCAAIVVIGPTAAAPTAAGTPAEVAHAERPVTGAPASDASRSASAPADAPTWLWVASPNVNDHPDSNLTPGAQPPYRIVWPGEGTSTTGEQDPACPTTPPYRNGHRVRTGSPDPTDKLHGVLGIWKRGPFVRVGRPTPGANHAANHLAVFFHTPDLDGRPCFRGGAEYGFLRKLAEGSTQAGDQPLDFYQCQHCNCVPRCVKGDGSSVSQRYTDKQTGWNDAERDRIYRMSFHDFSTGSFGVRCPYARDNFLIEVLDPFISPPALQRSVRICRAGWFPDLKGKSGWITTNAHADRATADGTDDFDGSYNQVITVKYLSA